MSKLALAGVSLIGAIPALFLAFFSINAYLSHSEHMHLMMTIVNGVTLLMAVVVIFCPIVILLKKGKSTGETKAAKQAGQPEAVAAAGAGAAAASVDPFELEAEEELASLGDDEFESFDADEEGEGDLFEFDED